MSDTAQLTAEELAIVEGIDLEAEPNFEAAETLAVNITFTKPPNPNPYLDFQLSVPGRHLDGAAGTMVKSLLPLVGTISGNLKVAAGRASLDGLVTPFVVLHPNSVGNVTINFFYKKLAVATFAQTDQRKLQGKGPNGSALWI